MNMKQKKTKKVVINGISNIVEKIYLKMKMDQIEKIIQLVLKIDN